jgi:acetylornithine deacetylase
MTTPETLSPRAILDRLVAFPTVSRDTNLPLIDWVESYLGAHGCLTGRVPSPCGTKSHLFAQSGPWEAGGTVLSGHSDVVPVDGQDWTRDPWRVTEEGGRLYGRGTCDMKGFVAQAVAAMVAAQSRPLKRPLQLALSYDEEVGCMAVADLARAMAGALPRAAAVIVGEPTSHRVVTGHKGGLGFRVQLRGFEVHSSIAHRGVSAIMEGARLIQWANDCNAAGAAAKPGPLAAPFDPPWTNLHVGMITGGTAHNITARDCSFVLTFRTVPGDTDWEARLRAEVARIEAGMKAIHPDTGITLTSVFDMPPLRPENGGSAEALTRRLTGDNGSHVVSYGTEGGQFQAQGYSAVVCGPGDIAQAHQPDEWLAVAEFEASGRMLARVIDDLCA